jgi:hypothetical protein
VQSAVITLAERTTRYCMIIALPHGRSADKVAALTEHITTLPAQLRKSLAWDCGKEMSGHAAFTIVTGIPVYFADPHSPWQRGTNENNGLIRYYLPKGSDLSVHTQHDLDDIAAKLNTGPAASWNTPPPPKPLDERGLPAAGQWHVGEAGDVAGAGLELAARHVGRAGGGRVAHGGADPPCPGHAAPAVRPLALRHRRLGHRHPLPAQVRSHLHCPVQGLRLAAAISAGLLDAGQGG